MAKIFTSLITPLGSPIQALCKVDLMLASTLSALSSWFIPANYQVDVSNILQVSGRLVPMEVTASMLTCGAPMMDATTSTLMVHLMLITGTAVASCLAPLPHSVPPVSFVLIPDLSDGLFTKHY
jgi:hypothetical protein